MRNYKGQELVEDGKVAQDFVAKFANLLQSLVDKRISDLDALQILFNNIDSGFSAYNYFVSCSECCCDCCYIYVAVSQMEADLIIRELKMLREPLKSTLRSNIDSALANWRAFKAIYPEPSEAPTNEDYLHAYAKQKMGCAFLVDKKCAIYKVRPLNCRMHWVYSNPGLCKIPGSRTDDIKHETMETISWLFLKNKNRLIYGDNVRTLCLNAWLEEFVCWFQR
jgi:Fe-S-cluster containining protein